MTPTFVCDKFDNMQSALKLRHPCGTYLARQRKLQRFAHLAAKSLPESGALGDWIRREGGGVNGVTINFSGETKGCELLATKDLTEGTTVVSLPQQCILLYDDDDETSKPLESLIASIPEEFWGARLALRVLSERAKASASRFSTYIENLPRGVPGIPMFFRREAVQSLQYGPTIQQINKRCRWLLNFSGKELQQALAQHVDLFEGHSIDANAMAWGMAVVSSRAFRIKGPARSASMLPLIDMSNHSFTPNCKIQSFRTGVVRMITLRDVRKGQPLTISYGNLDNDSLLLDYGFFVQSNPYDRVSRELSLDLVEAGRAEVAKPSATDQSSLASLPQWQRVRLEQLGFGPSGRKPGEVALRRSPPADPSLVAAVRVLAATDEGHLLGHSVQDLGMWHKPVHIDTEVLALRILAGICMSVLNSFPTTLGEDEVAIEAAVAGKEPMAADVLLASQFRAEKKRVLIASLQGIAGKIKELLPLLTEQVARS